MKSFKIVAGIAGVGLALYAAYKYFSLEVNYGWQRG